MFKHEDHTHEEVAVARLCAMGLTFTCSWLFLGFPVAPEGMTDEEADGFAEYVSEVGMVEQECGAAAWETARGWNCEAGHEHVSIEFRVREGWDYAGDEGEALLLRRAGVEAVAMDGTYIESAAS